MSTFGGLVEEIPGITVDRFDGDNIHAAAYFLTHSHSDHTNGLNTNFFQHLKLTRRRLYCTQLTKLLVANKFKVKDEHLPFIEEMKPCAPRIIEYEWEHQNEVITVNCVSAGHSPGSVMFIFEREDKRVLCTGDFRISPADLPRIKPLNSEEGDKIVPLKFDKIYLDTTFLNPTYMDFPPRSQSLETICAKALEWLERDPKHLVFIECSALTGSEFVYMEIMEKIGLPVHVRSDIYESYLRIEELSRCVTLDANATRVHACKNKRSDGGTFPCREYVNTDYILTIVVSAYRWKNRRVSSHFEWDKTKLNRFYVCCSMHPSYNELKAFLYYFQPLEVHPCVDPPSHSKISANEILKEIKKKPCPEPEKEISYDLTSMIRTLARRKRYRPLFSSDDSSE